MATGGRVGFLFQLLLILLAVSGWAAFAGTILRLHDAETRTKEAEENLQFAQDQNDRMREGSEALFHQQAGLVRMLQEKNQQLEGKVRNYESRLKQLGIIQ